jgi:hypothetical protein
MTNQPITLAPGVAGHVVATGAGRTRRQSVGSELPTLAMQQRETPAIGCGGKSADCFEAKRSRPACQANYLILLDNMNQKNLVVL